MAATGVCQTKGATVSKISKCTLCSEEFPSKTKLFKHLESTHGIVDETRSKPTRVCATVGWVSAEVIDIEEINDSTARYDETNEAGVTKRKVEGAFFGAIQTAFGSLVLSQEVNPTGKVTPKSYSRGSHDRSTAPNALERSAHGLADLFVFTLDRHPGVESTWVSRLNEALPDWIKCFSCKILPGGSSDFSAHQSCSQRRYEYLLPLKTILPSTDEEYAMVPMYLIEERSYNENPVWKQRASQSVLKDDFDTKSDEGRNRIHFFRVLKAIMKKFNGRFLLLHNFLSGGACPSDSSSMRVIDRMYHKSTMKDAGDETWITFSVSGDNFIRGQIRRMIGLVIALARGWLPMKYFDYAIYRAPYKEKNKPKAEKTTRDDDGGEQKKKRKKIDTPKEKFRELLHPELGEPREVPDDFESVCDLPAVPGAGLYLAECKYPMYESKHADKMLFLDPRRASSASEETDQESLNLLLGFEKKIQNHITMLPEMRRLMTSEWITDLRQACDAMVANADLANNLRQRKIQSLEDTQKNCVGFPRNMPASAFEMYSRVLDLLRQADKSGKWPPSSVGRRQVMLDYSTAAGEGSNGGTFSVGAFPSSQSQPKGNELFPELVRACFDLEKIILPHRKPSTTIAINRHAQFRFHRDSGAGSGQTKSAIVALGDFAGGELQCEFQVEDIRYSPYEFDGWGQRHSTLPFFGERYSLVWFTPLGLE